MNTTTGTIHPLPERVARLRGEDLAEDAGAGVRRWRLEGEEIRISRCIFPPGAEFDAHIHPEAQAVFVMSGRVAFWIEGREHTLEEGDSLIIPSHVVHGSRVLSDVSAEVLVIHA